MVLASTMRLSMSTWGVWVSRLRTRARAFSMLARTSLMMSTLVRVSTVTEPRSLSTSLTRPDISAAVA